MTMPRAFASRARAASHERSRATSPSGSRPCGVQDGLRHREQRRTARAPARAASRRGGCGCPPSPPAARGPARSPPTCRARRPLAAGPTAPRRRSGRRWSRTATGRRRTSSWVGELPVGEDDRVDVGSVQQGQPRVQRVGGHQPYGRRVVLARTCHTDTDVAGRRTGGCGPARAGSGSPVNQPASAGWWTRTGERVVGRSTPLRVTVCPHQGVHQRGLACAGRARRRRPAAARPAPPAAAGRSRPAVSAARPASSGRPRPRAGRAAAPPAPRRREGCGRRRAALSRRPRPSQAQACPERPLSPNRTAVTRVRDGSRNTGGPPRGHVRRLRGPVREPGAAGDVARKRPRGAPVEASGRRRTGPSALSVNRCGGVCGAMARGGA